MESTSLRSNKNLKDVQDEEANTYKGGTPITKVKFVFVCITFSEFRNYEERFFGNIFLGYKFFNKKIFPKNEKFSELFPNYFGFIFQRKIVFRNKIFVI